MQKLDCKGLACPEPVLRTRELIEKQNPSEFAVIVDNQPAVENITRYANNNGYVVSKVDKKGDSLFELFLEQVDSTMSDPVPGFEKTHFLKDTEIFNKNPMFLKNGESYADYLSYDNKNKTVVLLATDRLGHGDDELGAKLMENFLATLPEMNVWQIIMVNGGVRLAAQEGKNLENLEKLAAQGVKINVCGTCLSHFGLVEQKKIGETTNMLDIVTTLDLADKVIRP